MRGRSRNGIGRFLTICPYPWGIISLVMNARSCSGLDEIPMEEIADVEKDRDKDFNSMRDALKGGKTDFIDQMHGNARTSTSES